MENKDKVEIMLKTLKESLGCEGLVEELYRSLGTDILYEHLEYIANMNDIEIE